MKTGRVLLGLGLTLGVTASAFASPIVARAATGSLTVTEASNPTSDTGTFNLQIDGSTVATGACSRPTARTMAAPNCDWAPIC